jgi:hypothetical protein
MTPNRVDPNNVTPTTNTLLSFTDSFLVGGSVDPPYKIIISGGSYDNTSWTGSFIGQVTLTYIDG